MFDINSIKTLDVFSFEKKGEKTGLGLVINGVPYLLWTHVYQNLEMEHTHAVKTIRKLSPDQYISMNRSQLYQVLSRCAMTALRVFNSPVYYFITQEGFNRVIMDVDTSRMKDKKIADAIEKRKNKMAEIFTIYETGKLTLPAPKQKRIRQIQYPTGYTPIAPVFKDRKTIGREMGLKGRSGILIALEETEKLTGQDLSAYRNAIHLIPEEDNQIRYSSSAIADHFGISKRDSNKFLSENKLLEEVGYEWALTKTGRRFGILEPTIISSGRGTIVRHSPKWTLDVVDYLKKSNPLKGQKQLC